MYDLNRENFQPRRIHNQEGTLTHLQCHLCTLRVEVEYGVPNKKPVITALGNMMEHRRLAHDGRKFNCHLCDWVFKDLLNLARHLRVKHNVVCKGYPIFPCPYKDCNFIGKCKWNVENHLRVVHLHEKDFMCTACGKTFSTKAGLTEHTRLMCKRDKTSEERVYHCTICRKMFPEKRDLINHNKGSHRGIERMPCTLCPPPVDGEEAKLYSHGGLVAHFQMKHRVMEKKKCPKCPFERRFWWAICSHYRLKHLNYYQFKCIPCDRLFKQPYDVKWHILITHQKKKTGLKYGKKITDDIFTDDLKAMMEDFKISDAENYPSLEKIKQEIFSLTANEDLLKKRIDERSK